MITYPLRVCINSDEKCETHKIKRHDTGVSFEVSLVVRERLSQYRTELVPYHIPDGATAILRVHKPDNTKVVTDAAIDGSAVLCNLPPQTCTACGTCKAEINLYSWDGKRLTSATFTFDVCEECICDGDKESQSYFDILGKQIKDVVDASERAQDAAGRAEAAIGNTTWAHFDVKEDGHLYLVRSDNDDPPNFQMIDGRLVAVYE